MGAPDAVRELVRRFEEHREAYRSGRYNETQLRREFLDPFFEALGWDVNNRQSHAEAYKEVIHEDAVKVGGLTKAPDYSFRIGGVRKFFVEAKKPSISIKDDPAPAFQLRRYAWSAKLPLSILTDFDEFAVYDCRRRPDKADKPSLGRVIYLTSGEYDARWDEIAGIFAKDAILKGSFDRFATAGAGAKRGTAGVDAAFLAEIEGWRDLLARSFALRNPDLSVEELNFAVQRTIDRIIFLRICEDRGIEDYGSLLALVNGENVYGRLRELYRRADDRYNSGLFHFRSEKDRAEHPDTLTPRLAIDDKPLKEIIRGLYYPDSPYEFSVLPADILGQVYEQFLGKVIRLTAGHRAVVEEKPEVKKAGGVYYTPTYIVDYIVRSTVGKLLEGKTPKTAAEVRILDPACGSGSFLIGAYQHLLDWHRDWYVAHDSEKWAKGKNPPICRISLAPQAGRGSGEWASSWRLTTVERKRILLNNIYGVDIDSQAVEVTKLSLLLKVLEGENEETLARQLRMFHERALPDLGKNIKCGNSLIGPDFFDGRLAVDDAERARINAFDWSAEFPTIMKGSGFDVVIGNPPYVRQESLGDQKEYFQSHFRVYHGIADLYAYFVEKGIALMRSGGLFSYILSNKWLRANYGEPLRRWLKEQGVEEIVDFGDLPVFKSATTYPCILRVQRGNTQKSFKVTKVGSLEFTNLTEYVADHTYVVSRAALEDGGWSLANASSQALLDKIKGAGTRLGAYVQGKIFYGIKTGLNEAFVIDDATRRGLVAEDRRSRDLIKPFAIGRDIKRYRPLPDRQFLILIPKGWTRAAFGETSDPWRRVRQQYPAIAAHLEPFKAAAEKRCDKGDYWWELRACEYYDLFAKPKLLWPEIAGTARFAFDGEGYFTNNKVFMIPSEDMYLLGLLNSSLLKLFIHSVSTDLQGSSFNFSGTFLAKAPIRTIDFSNPADKRRHNEMVALVERMLDLHKRLPSAHTDQEKTALQRQIADTDRRIDCLVYDLYGLTEDEIQIVEGTA